MPKACSFVLNECLSRHHQEKPLKVKMSIICSEEKKLVLSSVRVSSVRLLVRL